MKPLIILLAMIALMATEASAECTNVGRGDRPIVYCK